MSERKTTVICFANNKGGSGKSTTCANVGYSMVTEGKRVLLIDDIITTGATISECARMLLNADAAVVHGAAVAAARTDNNFYRENDHATFFQRPGR